MKKLIVLGMALALMLSVAPAMAGDFGALTASITPMTDSELASVQGARGGYFSLKLIAIGNIAVGSQTNNNLGGSCVLQSNSAGITQITSLSYTYSPTWIDVFVLAGGGNSHHRR